MRYLFVLFKCFLIIACVTPAHAADTILVLGDSLSAAYGIEQKDGWVERLDRKLANEQKQYQIINASISGETTSGGRNRIDKLLSNYSPSIVMVELGANDGLRGLPLKAMYNNLAYIIKQSLTANAQVLLIGMQLPPNYGKEYTEQFHDVYKRLARKFGLAFAPFLIAGMGTDLSNFQADGLHPTAQAQQQIMENIWPYLIDIIDNKT